MSLRGAIKKEKIKQLFMRLKKAHKYYQLYGSDPQKHEEILAKVELLISGLDDLGIHRSFSEALLFFGKEFLDFEFGLTPKLKTKLKNGFGNRAKEHGGDRKLSNTMKLKDIVSEAEKIFGVKARQMTAEEAEMHRQVPKDALVYTLKDGKPKVLVYREGG